MSKVPDLRADATTDQFVLTHVNTGHISVHHLARVGGPTQDDLTAKYKRAGCLLALPPGWQDSPTREGRGERQALEWPIQWFGAFLILL